MCGCYKCRVTPRQLSRHIEQRRALSARYERLKERNDALIVAMEEMLREMLDTETTLPDRKHSGKVNVTEMNDSHAMAISRAHGRKSGKDLKFKAHIRDKGYTHRTLAAAINRSPAALTRYRSGDRPAPTDVVTTVKKLTGWETWPKISED